MRSPIDGFPVVGIGASAGGISAMRSFFRTLPNPNGLAFVVLPHRVPEQPGRLTELLRKSTFVPIREIGDGMAVEPNCIYVAQPGQNPVLEQGILRLRPTAAEISRPNFVDTFLESLAADRGRQSFAIILSGSDSVGATGAQKIRDAGGTVFVQDPVSTRHDGMPGTVIAAGAADRVLPIEAMAYALLNHTSTLAPQAPPAVTAPRPEKIDPEPALDELLALIHQQTGFDLSGYKLTPLRRQIGQRMKIRRIKHFDDYEDLLHDDPAELEALIRDIPIHVTEFFRDAAAWVLLAREVIAPMLKNHDGVRPIRIWTPACSSGEEAYSIAMLLTEETERSAQPVDFEIFATDASYEIVARASRGIFTEKMLEGISVERRKRFFYTVDGAYRIKKSLRKKIVFAPQHLLADPPISNVDLVTCRNLLIYLEPTAQQRLFSMLHASLRMGGCLFLGSGEALPLEQTGFETVSPIWHIYRKTGAAGTLTLELPTRLKPLPASRPYKVLIEERAHWAILEKFELPSVLVDAQFNLLRVYGNTTPFLRLPPGQPSLNLMQVIQPALATKLWIAADRALARGQAVTEDGLPDPETGSFTLRMRITPLHNGEDGRPARLLVSFIRSPAQETYPPHTQASSAADGNNIAETAIDRWKDALQLSLEELEASREELQALNEELRTVNDQLNLSNAEVNAVNAALSAKIRELETQSQVLSSGAVMTLFLDEALQIRWFTPALLDLFPLQPYDVGRQITELVPKFVDPNFIGDIHKVMQSGEPIESIVRTLEKRRYLRRIGPFRDAGPIARGVAITFTDISDRLEAEEALQRERSLLVSVMQATDVMLVMLDPRFNFVWVNPAYAETCRMQPDAMIGKNHFALYPNPENEAVFRQVRDTGEPVFFKDKAFVFPDQPERGVTYWDWSLVAVKAANGEVNGLVFSLRDTTPFKKAQEALHESETRFRILVESYAQAVWETNADGSVSIDSPSWREFTGQTCEEWMNNRWLDAMHPDDKTLCLQNWQAALQSGRNLDAEYRMKTRDGQWRWTHARATPLHAPDGSVVKWIGMNIDIDARKRAEAALQETQDRLRNALEIGNIGAWDLDLNDHTAHRTLEHDRIFGYDALLPSWTYELFLEHVLPEDRARVDARFKEASAGQSDWSFECRIRRRDGEIRRIWAAGHHRKDSSGRPCRMSGIVQDITELKLGEASDPD